MKNKLISTMNFPGVRRKEMIANSVSEYYSKIKNNVETKIKMILA